MLALTGFIACEEKVETPEPESSSKVSYELTANIAGPEGVALSWAAGDKVSVFESKGRRTFTTAEGGTSAIFTGEAEGTPEAFQAVYPSTTDQMYSGLLNMTLPTAQDGVAGGVDMKAALMTAYLSPIDAKVLEFKPVVAFAKISFAESNSVVSVELKSNDDEALSGQVRVGAFATPTIETRPNVQSTVTLTGNPLAGTYYIAVIPQTLNAGYTLTIVNEAEKRATVTTTTAVQKLGETTAL